MKREEMIDAIIKKMDSKLLGKGTDQQSFKYELADCALSAAEKAGMLPPPCKKMIIHPLFKSESVKINTLVNEWEDEE